MRLRARSPQPLMETQCDMSHGSGCAFHQVACRVVCACLARCCHHMFLHKMSTFFKSVYGSSGHVSLCILHFSINKRQVHIAGPWRLSLLTSLHLCVACFNQHWLDKRSAPITKSHALGTQRQRHILSRNHHHTRQSANCNLSKAVGMSSFWSMLLADPVCVKWGRSLLFTLSTLHCFKCKIHLL